MFRKNIILIIVMCLMVSGCTEHKKVSDIDDGGNYILPEKQLRITVWDPEKDEVSASVKNNVAEKWLNKKTNVSVSEVIGNNGKQWTDRLAQLVMDGALPDIVNVENGEGKRQFLKLDKIKKLYKLSEEEIKTYAPELWRKTPAEYWDYLKNEDGDILGIPYDIPLSKEEPFADFKTEEKEYVRGRYEARENDIFPQKNSCLWIRDDILEEFYPEAKSYFEIEALLDGGQPIGEMLLDVPIYSTEEYIRFMYDISERGYKTESGKRIYAFGYGGDDSAVALKFLGADMYGFKNYDYYTSWYNGEINLMLDDEIIKQALCTQNKMVNDDVISTESISDSTEEYKKKVLDGQYAIIAAEPAGGGESINKKLAESGKTFRYRPFLTKIESEYKPYRSEMLWGGAIGLLGNLSKNEVHQVLNWINVQYSDEFDMVRAWGPEDAKMYTEDENGRRLFKNDAFNMYFILEDESAVASRRELLGLSGNGLFNTLPMKTGRWAPAVMYGVSRLTPDTDSGFKPADEGVLEIKPVSDINSSIFAEIPEVSEFLNNKQEIERWLKEILVKNPEDFDEEWTELIQNVNNITDISEMLEKMTATAKIKG